MCLLVVPIFLFTNGPGNWPHRTSANQLGRLWLLIKELFFEVKAWFHVNFVWKLSWSYEICIYILKSPFLFTYVFGSPKLECTILELETIYHVREFGKSISHLSAQLCICARHSWALSLKTEIWSFRAITESILPFNILMYLLNHMLCHKNPSYFAPLFHAPLCFHTLLLLLASFLSQLVPLRPLGFVTARVPGKTVLHRSPRREKAEDHCTWDSNISIGTSSGFEHRWYYAFSYREVEDRRGEQRQSLCELLGRLDHKVIRYVRPS